MSEPRKPVAMHVERDADGDRQYTVLCEDGTMWSGYFSGIAGKIVWSREFGAIPGTLASREPGA